MENKRMQQLVFMFSYLTGKSEKESEFIIMQTETGIAVTNNNKAVLYEQQTENLYSIAMELSQSGEYQDVVRALSDKNIVKAMKQLRSMEQENRMNNKLESLNAPQLDTKDIEKAQSRLLERQKEVWKQQKQNWRNARRIEYVDKVKR